MRLTIIPNTIIVALLSFLVGCGSSVPPDEALQRVRAERERGDYAKLGPGTSAEEWTEAAEKYYPPAYWDYFHDMDVIGSTDGSGPEPVELSPEAIKGRNAWVIWTGGNQAWWDWIARNGYGSIDLLKLIDDRGREQRFATSGLINEPGTREPKEDETIKAHGIRYARPVKEPEPGFPDVHVEYRDGGKYIPEEAVYGYPTGVVGLRLFKNPEFDEAAKDRWEAEKYYNDPEYAARPDTIRPFRVGMSCGYCHIAPHPLNPPLNPEFPKWENLSNNVGNQFMRMRVAFGNTLKPDNYLYHVLDSMLPGAVDTSGYPSDNNNNPNTINSFYGLRGRVERAPNTPRERLSPESLAYVRDYTDEGATNPRHVPKVLFDGSDSLGVHVALSRVYLNIGTHHQQWIRTTNPLLGFSQQKPFSLNDIAENSLYWHAIRIRIRPLAEFFLNSTDPMRLKDVKVVQGTDKLTPEQYQTQLLKTHLRGTGLPWYTKSSNPEDKPSGPPIVGDTTKDYSEGRRVFAKGCIACHSSVQPGDLLALELKLAPPSSNSEKEPRFKYVPNLGEPLPDNFDQLPTREQNRLRAQLLAPRRQLRLSTEDRHRLTRGDGTLPSAYAEWAQEAVKHREFWEHSKAVRDADGNIVKGNDGKPKMVTVHNFMSIDERLPVTIPHTNTGRATATNALHGNVWEDFASQTYKELGEVGPVSYHDPISGAERSYSPPSGGPGYYRVPTLISIWATAPLLHNNALGKFNNDPSVKGRLEAFDDAINRLLWPSRRATPSEQVYWPGEGKSGSLPDAWYPGKDAAKPSTDGRSVTQEQSLQAADQRDLDRGWVWRTTEESWFKFDAPHVPMLLGGAFGQSAEVVQWLAWVPSIFFVLLGIIWLLSDSIIAGRQRIERRLPWLAWLLSPLRWIGLVIGVVLLIGSIVLLWRYWKTITLLDIGTEGSIWGLRILVVLIPVVLFGSVVLLKFWHQLPEGQTRTRVAYFNGVVCLILAVIIALGIGRTVSGNGADVRVGPIPEGVPVNIIANIDPNAPTDLRLHAIGALIDFFVDHHESAMNDTSAEAKAERRREFEATVAPALMQASKCPDFITDRGHDYRFIEKFTDEEKMELIALLKTF